MRALLSVASREGIGPFVRDLLALDVEVFATDGTREALAGEGVEVRSVVELTGSEAIAGGQVKTLHPAIYAGILARRDQPDQLAELKAQGIGLIDLVAVNVTQFAPQVGARLIPIDEAIEHDRHRRRCPPRGRGPQLRRRRRCGQPGPLPRGDRRDPAARGRLGGAAPEARGRGIRSRGRLPRGDRRLPFQRRRRDVSQTPGHGPREGGRPALRRESAPARRLLPRNDAPVRHAGRCHSAAGGAAVLQRPAGPRRGLRHRRATSRRRR